KQRLRDIGEARRVLDQIVSGAAEPVPPAPAANARTRSARSRILPWAIAAAAIAGAAAIAVVPFRDTPPMRQIVRFQVRPPEKSSIGAFALSPDGLHLAFATSGNVLGVEGTNKLWLRPLDSLGERALPGTEGAAFGQDQLFWSPDGAFIGYTTLD